MAIRDELAPFVLGQVEGLDSSTKKGGGSYGAIFEVTVNSTPCIAKRLHDILVDYNYVNPSDIQAARQRFRQECVLLSKLEHPNVVRFIGVHYGRNPDDLSLIMEKLHTDLDKYLETHPNIPVSVKLSILYDVSCGLLYLHEHSPPIIHRDLTARNILLTYHMRAKIADLGVSKLFDLRAQVATAQTKAPGMIYYMPPEALTHNPQYDEKLDIFSFGQLALYTVTQTFPQPDDSKITESAVRKGEVQIAKREMSIDQTGTDHCLYPLITQCLKDKPDQRPTTQEVNQMLQQLYSGGHLAVQIRAISEIISNGHPAIYKPPMHEVMRDPIRKIAKYLVNHSRMWSQTTSHGRVLMLVGATGAGKSTLINAIGNYILGVRWEDDFRFKLITDEWNESQAHSQTKWITAYTFHKMEGSRIPYTLTIIDTPGFGDTKGVERDKEITSQIKEFFSIPIPNGIDQIHGIGFVAQASLPRLTPTQRYIFDSILSIYGKDIADNIFMMFTFADGKKPPILAAIEAADIPYREKFMFNNSVFVVEQDVEENGSSLDKDFWKMGFVNLESFFNHFERVDSKSLQLTQEVSQERQQLEIIIQGLQPQIRAGLSKIDELRQEEMVLRQHGNEMVKNKNFTYTVTVTKQKRIDITGKYVTNCLKCNFTCHFPCHISYNKYKSMCVAMECDTGSCKVCPLKCNWQEHVNNTYRFELYEEEETRCFDSFKAQYYKAREGKSAVEAMVAKKETELKELQMVVFCMIQDAQQSLKRLDEIALKPDPLSEVDYIDLLIASEKQQAQAGFTERIKSLQDIGERAKILATMQDRSPSVGTVEGPSRKTLRFW